jgi:hypothetical protein
MRVEVWPRAMMENWMYADRFVSSGPPPEPTMTMSKVIMSKTVVATIDHGYKSLRFRPSCVFKVVGLEEQVKCAVKWLAEQE